MRRSIKRTVRRSLRKIKRFYKRYEFEIDSAAFFIMMPIAIYFGMILLDAVARG